MSQPSSPDSPPTTELSVEDRTVFALVRYVFPKDAIVHAHKRAGDIANGDAEVEEHLRLVLGFAQIAR